MSMLWPHCFTQVWNQEFFLYSGGVKAEITSCAVMQGNRWTVRGSCMSTDLANSVKCGLVALKDSKPFKEKKQKTKNLRHFTCQKGSSLFLSRRGKTWASAPELFSGKTVLEAMQKENKKPKKKPKKLEAVFPAAVRLREVQNVDALSLHAAPNWASFFFFFNTNTCKTLLR